MHQCSGRVNPAELAETFRIPRLFSTALVISAALLFSIQPMIAKMILPKFGGSSSVWTTCMVFFQVTLLAGYAYAHLTARWLGSGRQAIAHLALMAAAALALPIAVSAEWAPPGGADPAPRLLALLLVTVGAPFLVVSASAPLLQSWFGSTGHPSCRDPYFLYSASNTGSIGALMTYPLLVEPNLTLNLQGRVWSGGYVVLVVFVAACALTVWRSPTRQVVEDEGPAEVPVSTAAKARWVALAFVPSSMMLAVTSHLTEDVSPVPLLWVVPLALYLLSFIIVFRGGPAPRLIRATTLTLPVALAAAALLVAENLQTTSLAAQFTSHLLAFFAVAMACHGELARDRPTARSLTEFYLWMSVGGALGGLFVALVAPVVFPVRIEYPLSLILTALLMPGAATSPRPVRAWNLALDFATAAAVGAAAAMLLFRWRSGSPALRAGAPALTCLLGGSRPIRFGLGLAALLVTGGVYYESGGRVVHRERNFYGTLSVIRGTSGRSFTLLHGRIRHGAQNRTGVPRFDGTPLLYYYPTGPAGKIFASVRGRIPTGRVAVLGLGVGSLAGYGKPGQEFDFFEIDAAVARIASDPNYFTFLRDSRARCRVVLGDARLALHREPPGRYSMIVSDAFSGDAVPIHLLTREAIRLYLEKLANGGLLVFHISNSYLDFGGVLGDQARAAGLVGLDLNESAGELSLEEFRRGKTLSRWVVLARRWEDLGGLSSYRFARPLTGLGRPPWTDDVSNLLATVRWD